MRSSAAVFLVALPVLVVGAPSARADADQLVDGLGPREIAMGEASRAAATGATAIALNPAGLALNHELVFEGSYGYRGTDAAAIINASACDSTTPVAGCFFYGYVGVSPTDEANMDATARTHSFGIAGARAISPRITVGSTLRYFDYESTRSGDKASSGFAYDLGMTARPSEMISVGFVGYNLLGASSTQFPRGLGTGILLHPSPSLSGTFDARWHLDADGKTGRFGGGLEYFFQTRDGQSGYPFRAGALHDRENDGTYVTGGLGYQNMKFSLDLGARKQVQQGDELLFTASLRFFGPRDPGNDGWSVARGTTTSRN